MPTVKLTKKAVTVTDKTRSVQVNLQYVADNNAVLINQDFTGTYYANETPKAAFVSLAQQMQAAIDNYKLEETVLASVTLDNAITQLQNSLKV